MRKVKVEKAVGMMLAHDMTKIVPGEFKGVGFRRGHVVREEDVRELLRLGKRFVFVENLDSSRVHEEEAAKRIAAAISGTGIRWTSPQEGKINLVAAHPGLLRVDAKALYEINLKGDVIVSSLKDGFPCREGQTVAATRIIPLTISRGRMERLEAMVSRRGPVIRVLPFRKMSVGAVVTGYEVATGLVKDAFDDYIGRKIIEYGCELCGKVIVGDDPEAIAHAIWGFKEKGCDLILTTGGLSVDPDDNTRKGIRASGAKVIFYGTPVLPGAMFLLATLGDVPILGLPACVFYYRTTMFDLMLARILAGEMPSRKDVARMGHGGLCLNCETCRYPACSFGK
jgi:molybdopterin biosynthesis enzyme